MLKTRNKLGLYVGQARNKHAVPAYFMEPKSKFQLAMDASDPHGATPAQIWISRDLYYF